MSIAAFGGLVFQGGLIKGTPLSEYSVSFGVNTDKQEQQTGKPATLVKGAQLSTIAFTIHLMKTLGVNPESVIAQAQKLCEAGVPYPLIIGNKPASTNRFLLTAVSIDDTYLNGAGKILSTKMKLQFEEFVKEGTKQTSISGVASSSAPGVSSISATDGYKVTTVSGDDKAGLKREFVSMAGE
ncbi:MAG: phage tail protein [Candidatus Fimivivens sp.]|nr:phage tail protein [Candidatus Fimivivens sp.]